MRLIRLGGEPSKVGADVRAALSTWGVGDAVLGGVALLGVRPPDCPRELDAVLVLPRGVLVVVGVDLPDPAKRLEAPLGGTWTIDGWPLSRGDGATSPAAEALEASSAVARRIQDMRGEPLPVTTVVAVGPYVGHVVQPTVDLNRGVRVLHPKPTTLLAAARELATGDRPCPVDQAARLIAVLAPTGTPPDPSALRAEGFPDAAVERTVLLPRAVPAKPPAPRWFTYVAVAVAAAVVLAVVVSLVSGGGPETTPQASASAQPTTVVVDGQDFVSRGTDRTEDCESHAFGDVRAWLGEHLCLRLDRAQFETKVDGRVVGVAVAELSLPDPQRAGQFGAVAAAAGSGGVTPLVKEGKGWPGGPASFDRSAIRTTVTGARVRIAQVVWADGESAADDPKLVAVAERASKLPPGP
ncbi:hypothetical protein GCM10022243_46740 [Saccharothrix violaceirubra]|uniref:Uncharacterized protein n=1 Tax=Saccharothrix violaceirubra TaxID=413306 RepID=A0A7W7T9N9_9PSEU|nr:hypothetical protein [Saccharothrix violaceirubra]MBB4967785.1 hypothetical protein [Saccharothrix violaceirubra]